MKIRSGFVSNSSSSSFLMYGTYVSSSDIEKLLEKDEELDDGMYELEEYMDAKGVNLRVWSTDYRNDFYVGRSWSDIGGEQTGNQFKAEVTAELKKVFGDKVKVATHQEAWYNG